MRGNVLVERDLIGLVPPPPPPLAVTRLVDDDAIDPGLQCGLAAEVVNGAEYAEEDFLREVEGFVAVTQQVQGELVDHPFMARDEFGAGGRLACRAAFD